MVTSGSISSAPAPGSRVSVRGEEWLVTGSTHVITGGFAVNVIGISELVRDKKAIFLNQLDTITEVRPEETKLVLDTTAQYRRSRLYLEALLRRTQPTDEKLQRSPQLSTMQEDILDQAQFLRRTRLDPSRTVPIGSPGRSLA